MSIFKKFGEWVTPHRKRCYHFSEGSWDDKALLGNKGADLCELYRLKLPVPIGFVLTTEACNEFLNSISSDRPHETKTSAATILPHQFIDEYTKCIHELERQSGRLFSKQSPSGVIPSNTTFPLLLSVRSSTPIVCHGLSHTILNLGMNDEVCATICNLTQNPRFAYDSYIRFLRMYGTTVLDIADQKFEDILVAAGATLGSHSTLDLRVADMQQIVKDFKKLGDFPSDPYEQLHEAIISIFKSWLSPKAKSYRDLHHFSHEYGSACIIQMMVFGNMNSRSGTGVCYTRNPSTGEKQFFGEYLASGEGEDVSIGQRASVTLDDMRQQLPVVYDTLAQMETSLEKHYKDMLDIEFTVENGRLFLLETRPGRRTPQASVRVAVALVHEKLLTEREALLRIDSKKMDYFLHPIIDPIVAATGLVGLEQLRLGQGFAGSPGAAVGSIAFTPMEAKTMIEKGLKVILCLNDVTYDDEHLVKNCEGIMLMKGSVSSPASVIARLLGKPAIFGLETHCLSQSARTGAASAMKMSICTHGMQLSNKDTLNAFQLLCADNKTYLNTGDIITIDGSHGVVYKGAVPTVPAGQDADYQTLLRWADKYKRMAVLATADDEHEVNRAIQYGADGIGLCHSTNMFYKQDRNDCVSGLLLSSTAEERENIMKILLPLHREDFLNMFRQMHGKRISVVLMDPRAQDFLPLCATECLEKFNAEIKNLSDRMSLDADDSLLLAKHWMRPINRAMLGTWKGDTKLFSLYPEITEMQVKAILGAAVVAFAEGINIYPEILIPSIFTERELDHIRPYIDKAASSVFADSGFSIQYRVGCLLDNPRACLRADIIAKRNLDFMCFDLNGLTHHTYGTTKHDINRIMGIYMKNHIIARDPYVSLDEFGVGALIATALNKCEEAKVSTILGAYGTQVSDSNSADYLDSKAIDYVVCAASAVPAAKITAAQAHIRALAKSNMVITTYECDKIGERARQEADYWRLMSEARMF